MGELLLIAGALVCLILLMKAGFDRAEARSKSENGGKKFSSVLCYDFSQPMTLQDRDHMLELCRRIYRETDPKKLALWIADLNQLIQRKIDELRKQPKSQK